jgi:hypothetical protein
VIVQGQDFGYIETLKGIFQNGWEFAALMAGLVVYFYRDAQAVRKELQQNLKEQNDLAKRVTDVMERLESKAERRDGSKG